jgi:dihydroorotase
VFTAHAAIELYAEAFDQVGMLDRLEGFASRFGPAFHGLPCNGDTITLTRDAWPVPESLPAGAGETIVPLRSGGTVAWRLAGHGDG